MRRFTGLIGVMVVLTAGCGSNDAERPAAQPSPEPAPAEATSAATPAATAEPFEKGHSRAVREFYGGGDAPVPPSSDVEAEYHQPPRPATGGIGDTITLTGTNVGVRLRTTLTGLVDDVVPATESPRPGMRYVGVRLRLRSTGIAIHESALQSARLRYAGGAAKPVLGVKAPCSNGFDGTVRLDVGLKTRGCLLFELPENADPREFALALETVPPAAGGRWRLH
jgi:hypothetical protein